MKRSSQFSLMLAMKKSLVSLGAVLAAVLACESALLAATPVDIYQDMESGNNGNALTATIMNASSYPSGSSWSASSGTLWVSTNYPRNLPGPIVVGGTTYNGTSATRTWAVNNNNANNFVSLSIPTCSNITLGAYYTTANTVRNTLSYDVIIMWAPDGRTFAVMQNMNDGGTSPYIRTHSKSTDNPATVSGNISITTGKTYWINLKYDGAAGRTYLAAFDPDNSFAQVGTTQWAQSVVGDAMGGHIDFGRADNHGPLPADTTQSWYGQICIDYTNHVFPLIPSGSGTDTTPPSAPPAVRDGTGTDISTTSSTTQLSANWDASTDSQSGISGYQYAIGTSAGGTQTVNWTSLGNVTTVTKTGLTLTVGQTYFFSVKAVNGVGLTGSATNSNGQTVVAGSSVIFSDNFENWTVHGGAWSSVNGETSTHTLNTSTDYAASGTKGLKITDADTTATSGAYLTKNLSPAISGDVYVRFYLYLPTGWDSTNTGCNRRLLQIRSANGSETTVVENGNSVYLQESIDSNCSTAASFVEGQWHCIELHVASPSTSTVSEYWLDGVYQFSVTANFSSAGAWSAVDLGDPSLGGGSSNGTGTFYMDEAVISTAYNGPLTSALPSGWSGADINGSTPTGSASFQNGVFTVTGGGNGYRTGATSDQFYYVYEPASGYETIIAEVTTMSLTSGSASIMFRNDTTAGAAYAAMDLGGDGSMAFRYRTSTGGSSSASFGSTSAPSSSNPVWLKLVYNSNNTFSGYYSTGTGNNPPTGAQWTLLSTSTTFSLSSSYLAGLGATDFSNGTSVTDTFPYVAVTGPALSLTGQNINNASPVGSVTGSGSGPYTVVGGGNGYRTGATSDQFYYATTSASGHETIIAEVTTMSLTSGSASIMFRNDTTAGAAYAAMDLGGDGSMAFRYRTSTGGSSSASFGSTSAPSSSNPVWLKLVYNSNNTFSGYYSTGTGNNPPTGAQWTLLSTSTTFSLSSSYLAGLGATDFSNGTSVSDAFPYVAITSP